MRQKRLFAGFAVLCLAVLMFGCSEDKSASSGPEPAKEGIGPEGGTVELAGVAKLTIPVGALSDTVDFTIISPSSTIPPGAPLALVAPMCKIGPSGTQFAVSATLTMIYSENALGGADEGAVMIYGNYGSGWVPMPSTVNQADNEVTTSVTHLSDFAAVVDTTSSPAEGIYTKLIVSRQKLSVDPEYYVIDMYVASFDSSYAPCDPVRPIHSVHVTCNADTLVWISSANLYQYPELIDPLSPFITPGNTYAFMVTADNHVPALTESITFPTLAPSVTSPDMSSNVSRSGFTVTWDDTGSGTVEIILMSTGEPAEQILFVETPNTGSYSVTAGDLTDAAAGIYSVILNHYNRRTISAAGYDPRSFIAGRVQSTSVFHLQ